MFFKSLGTVFITIAVAAVLITGIAVSVFTFENAYQSVNSISTSLRKEKLGRVVDHLHVFFDIPLSVLNENARLLSTGVLDPTNQDALSRHFLKQNQEYASFNSIYFGNVLGGLAVGGVEALTNEGYLITTKDFKAGPFRKFKASESGSAQDLLLALPSFDARTRPWYKAAIQSKSTRWGDAYILFTGHDMAITPSKPVFGRDGELLGVVGGDIFLSGISQFLRDLHADEPGLTFIMDKDGFLLASSSMDERPFQVSEEGKAKARLMAIDSGVGVISNAALSIVEQTEGLKKVEQKMSGTFSINGERHFVEAAPFRGQHGLFLWIANVVPERSYTAELHEGNKQTLLLIAIALILMAGVTVLFVRRVTKPLTQLTASIDKMADGDLSEHLDLDRQDEIGVLSRSFEQMRQKLAKAGEITAEQLAQARNEANLASLFQDIFEGANVGIMHISGDRKLIHGNQRLADILGYGSPSEMVGLSMNALHLTDKRFHEFGAAHFYALKEKNSLQVEYDLRRKNGSAVTCMLSGRALDENLPADLAKGVIWVVDDISERKSVEKQLRASKAATEDAYEKLEASEKQNRLLLDSTGEGIYGTDVHGLCTFANPAALKLLGFEHANEVIGHNVHNLIHHAHADSRAFPEEECPLSLAWTHGELVRGEDTFWNRNGQAIPVHFTATPIIADDENVGSVVSFADISDLKKSQETIVTIEKRFRDIATCTSDWIWELDTTGCFTYASESVKDHLGYTADELLGVSAFDLMSPEEAERVGEVYDEIVSERRPFSQMLNCNMHKDGHSVAFESSGVPMFDDAGEWIGYRGADRNIDDIKKSQEQLAQAQKMETVGNLTGGIAHDFNNLLGIILGNLQLVQRRLQGDELLSKFLEDALDATQRGADLTRQLLAFSRRQQLSPEIVNVNDEIRKMKSILLRTIGSHIHVHAQLKEDLPFVKVDVAQLESALLNLGVNARDAMPKGGDLVLKTEYVMLDRAYVSDHREASEGPHVCISIIDSGTGIAPKDLDNIFEPFFTTKDAGKGTGLGLSMVYGFVSQSGGHVTVKSEEDHGTTFRLYLPCAEHMGGVLLAHEKRADIPHGTETILVVDDEMDFRSITGLQLEDLGYTVTTEESGVSVLNHLNVIPKPDLLLTDMIMPGGVDGQELANKLREVYPDLRVLLMTGFPRDAFSDGRDYELLQKPYTYEQLAEAVYRALNKEAT